MTKAHLISRLLRIKGLMILDPWGELAFVERFDPKTEIAWLRYEGLHVPFERTIDELLLAALGEIRSDLSEQFVKRVVCSPGLTLTFHYERNWSQSEQKPKKSPQPLLESLQASIPRRSKRKPRPF